MYFESKIDQDFLFGVLRRNYFDHINNAIDFCWAKLHPIKPANGMSYLNQPWQPSSDRHEILLPGGAPDLLVNPRRLLEIYEEQAPANQKDLLTAIKLTAPFGTPLHEFWETARTFARTALIAEHRLPTILVLHVPSVSGARSPNRPHIHLMALARELNGSGFSSFGRLANERAQVPLLAAWREIKRH